MSAENRRQQLRTPLAGDHYVLIELPNGKERLEPIVDLSPEGVAILIRVPDAGLLPGVTLPRLRFFVRGSCSLDTRASVRSVSQVSLEDGGIGLKVGVRLEPSEATEGRASIDVYDTPEVIVDTLTNLVAARAQATLSPAGVDEQEAALPVSFLRLRDDRSRVVTTWDAVGKLPMACGDTGTLVCELYGTRLALEATLLQIAGKELHFQWPISITVWRHRSSGRLRAVPNDVEIDFAPPFTRAHQRREVVDLSPHGVAFVSPPTDAVLLGMHLSELVLHLPSGPIRADAIVRNVRHVVHNQGDRILVGVELLHVAYDDAHRLGSFIAAAIHPQLRAVRAADMKRLWSIYDAAGMFHRQRAALSPVMGRIETTRKILLDRGRDLLLQIVAVADGQVQGTAELIRTGSGTWSLQHIGTHPASRVGRDQLVVPLVESALGRSDFRYLHALLDTESKQEAIDRLRSFRPDPEDISWSERVLLSAGSSVNLEGDEEVQAPGQSDLAWIAGKLHERLAPLEWEALDLNATALPRNDLSRLYHTVGLKRRRFARLSLGVSGPTGFALIEQSSPGLSFAGHADLIRLLPMARHAEARADALTSLTRDALQLQRRVGKPSCLFLVQPKDAPTLMAAGFESLGPHVEVFTSRAGARQMVNVLNLVT